MLQYYKPWDLLPSEVTRIEDQTREAQSSIDEELTELAKTEEKKPQQDHYMEDAPADNNPLVGEDVEMDPVGEDLKDSGASTSDGQKTDRANANDNLTASDEEIAHQDILETTKDIGHDAEEVDEGQEDTVIY